MAHAEHPAAEKGCFAALRLHQDCHPQGERQYCQRPEIERGEAGGTQGTREQRGSEGMAGDDMLQF